jgi:ribosomal-protein-alanine N-acetyltransferase
MPDSQIVFETVRLTLRRMVMNDLDFIASLLADPEVMRFYPHCYSREQSQRWVQGVLDGYDRCGHSFFLVMDMKTHEPLGQVGLLSQNVDGVEESEIGYLIHRPFWRQGFASEAAIGTRDYAFDELGKRRLISLIRPINIPSQGVAKKVGMTVEKTTMHSELEHLVFSLTRDED